MKKYTFYLSLILLSIFIGCKTNSISKDQILWYKQAANKWEEALPIGNGHLGAMIFGDPISERIQLNDDSLWPGDLGWNHPDGNSEDLKEIRKLLFQGNIIKVDSLLVKKFSRKTVVRSHQTLGDLFINFEHKNITDYKRSLNLNQSISYVEYKADGFKVTQKSLASFPDKLILFKFKSDHPNGLNGTVSLSRPKDEGVETARTFYRNGSLIMEGEVTQRKGVFDSKPTPIERGVKFQTILKPIYTGGKLLFKDSFIELKGVKELELRIVSNSSYYYNDFQIQNINQLKKIEKKSIDQIKRSY